MTFGVGKGQQGVVIILTFGTGIGSAIFTGGQLVPNTELGHLEVRGKDAELRASAQVRKKKKLSWAEWAVRVDEYLARLEVCGRSAGGSTVSRLTLVIKFIQLVFTEYVYLPIFLPGSIMRLYYS